MIKEIIGYSMSFVAVPKKDDEKIPNNVIRYYASNKLVETTSNKNSGLHTNAFNATIKSHTFKDGVGIIEFDGDITNVGDYAFYNILTLTEVILPESTTRIGYAAFYLQNSTNSFRSIVLPKNVNYIGDYAFSYCKSSINIPDKVTYIGTQAFSGTLITSITIPSSVINIGYSAFSSCLIGTFINNSNLDEIENNYWGARIVDLVINGFCILNNILIGYRGNDTNLVIPDVVTSIESSIFLSEYKAVSLTIPSSVTSITYPYAFGGLTCSYFINNSNLDEEAANYWGASVFDRIENGLFIRENKVVNYDYNYFSDKNHDLIIPEGVTSIDCSLSITVKNIYTSSTLTNYSGKFAGCICDTIIINTKTVPSRAVGTVRKVILGENVETVETSAFLFLNELQEVEILSNKINILEYHAFNSCNNLEKITVISEIAPPIVWDTFYEVKLHGVLMYPEGSDYSSWFESSLGELYDWGSSENYKVLAKLTLLDNTIVDILGNRVILKENTSLYKDICTRVLITSNCTYINVEAFRDFVSLTDIVLPDSVARMNSYVFSGCRNLTNVTFNNTLTYVPYSTFVGCTSLVNIILPDNITTVGELAFSGCSNLESITFGRNVLLVGNDGTYTLPVFNGCTKLASITCLSTTPPDINTGHHMFGEGNALGFDLPLNGNFYIPLGSLESYQNSEWLTTSLYNENLYTLNWTVTEI